MSDGNATVALGRLQNLVGCMEEFAAVSERFCEAVTENDGSVRALARRCRQARSSVLRARRLVEDIELPETRRAYELVDRMRPLTAMLQLGDQALRAWIAGQSAPAAGTETTPEGAARLIDVLLPPDWDLERDFALLVGPGGEAMARELVSMGQKRLVVYLPQGADAGGFPPEAVVVSTDQELELAVGAAAQPPPEHLVAWRLPQEDVSEERHRELIELVAKALEDVHFNRNTVRVFGETWVLQAIGNLPDVARHASVAALRGAFARKPAVVISPGPSLSKNIEAARALKGKAVLIAVSHALDACRKAGLIPDYAMVLDAQDLGYHFEGFPVEKLDGLIVAATAHPKIFRLPARRVFTFVTASELDAWIHQAVGDEMMLRCGGSVSTTAFSLAEHMGCNPIALIGQDLAFTGGKMYCDLSADGETRMVETDDGQFVLEGWSQGYGKLDTLRGARRTEARRIVKVRAWDGDGEVPTSVVFDIFRRWFEARAREIGDQRRLLNCTEGGAYIDGLEHVALTDAGLAGEVDVATTTEAAMKAVDFDTRRQRIAGAIRTMREKLATSANAARHCLALARRVERYPQKARALARAEETLVQGLRGALFISLLRQEPLQDILADMGGEETMTTNLDTSRRLYQLVLEAEAVASPILRIAEESVSTE